jgi:hypothetical protein
MFFRLPTVAVFSLLASDLSRLCHLFEVLWVIPRLVVVLTRVSSIGSTSLPSSRPTPAPLMEFVCQRITTAYFRHLVFGYSNSSRQNCRRVCAWGRDGSLCGSFLTRSTGSGLFSPLSRGPDILRFSTGWSDILYVSHLHLAESFL